MKKILGLDLGVSSIGWALVNEAENNNENSSIIKLGVRINPLRTEELQNFEKGKSITTNADRRLKRGMRRNLQRKKLRRRNLIDCLIKNGIITDETVLCENGNNTTFQTYRMRAKAVNEQVSLDDFARILLMINKKRGYKSNRKAKSNDEGVIIDSMQIAKELHEKGITPGQYTYAKIQEGKKYIPDFYHSDLQNEFDRIYKAQSIYYPDILNEEFFGKIRGKGNKATKEEFKTKYGITAKENISKDKQKELYLLRAKSLDTQLDTETIAYVLGELNEQINNSNNYLGRIGDRSKELSINNLTVGQMLMKTLNENPNASLTKTVYYRQDYLDEFERIWETQKQTHKELTDTLKKEIRDKIIFYQRNLRSQKGLVGLCQFEKGEIEITEADGNIKKKTIGRRTCPKSSPLFQEFKIRSAINNLVLRNDSNNEERPLDIREQELLFKELNVKEKLKKNEILKILSLSNREYDLNYNEVEGNSTLSAILKACQSIITYNGYEECNYAKMKSDERNKRIEQIFGLLKFKYDFIHFNSNAENINAEPMMRLWHLLYSYSSDKSRTGIENLVCKIAAMTNMDKDSARIIAGITFQNDYAALSSKAIGKILPHLKNGYKYNEACTLAGYNQTTKATTQKEHLELLQRNSLRNPVVEKILNQMVNVVNAISLKYGKPDEIRIELARELKSSIKERENTTKNIEKQKNENNRICEILKGEPFFIANPSRNDITRYKLYEELKDNEYKTLYSGKYISKKELFGNKFDIEHIIPQSLLFNDSIQNKTLELNSVNRNKSNRTAYDYMTTLGVQALDKYKENVNNLYNRKAISKEKYKWLLMQEKDIPSDFINRDLRDTQYIAKKALEILSGLVTSVVSTGGKITNRLREDWQLTNIMQELNWEKYNRLGLTETIVNRHGQTIHRIKNWTKRNDHRHHAMDALAIAFTKRGIVQYLNSLNSKNTENATVHAIGLKYTERDKHGKQHFKLPFEGFRAEARHHLENILVSIKSKSKVVTRSINKSKAGNGQYNEKVQLTPRGQLHNETIYGSRKYYSTSHEKPDSSFNTDKIALVANKRHREALLARLAQYNGDAKKAFTGKNSPDKNPIYLDTEKSKPIPSKVKLVELKEQYTIRKNIDYNLKIEKVADSRIKQILKNRLAEYGNDAKTAFANLDENPIWLNKEKGIRITRVKIIENSDTMIPLHSKQDNRGNFLLDKKGNRLQADFVKTANNHHAAIYTDKDGNYRDKIVSFYEATEAANQGLPIITRENQADEGWHFMFSMKQNEYFVFPNESTGFNPEDTELTNPQNYAEISKNLYRVQKISKGYYCFRHHLETTVDENKALKDITWKRITSLNNLKGVVKVRINHIGEIEHIGE